MVDGPVAETYHAALQHDLVDRSGDEHLAGVVREPTGWFYAEIDANYPELGPPADLLAEAKERTDALEAGGLGDDEAHNAAWEEVEFERRYLSYLDDSPDAQQALDELAKRVQDGQPVVLVCFEGEDKRCHRRLLVDRLTERI